MNCSSCGAKIGLGYRTDDEGQPFCSEACKVRLNKENRAIDALIAMALHPDGEAIMEKVAEKLTKAACSERRCGWHGFSEEVLRAPDPFNPAFELLACPQCRQQTIRTCCDEPGCWEEDTIGAPTPAFGYRRTCHVHQPKPL